MKVTQSYNAVYAAPPTTAFEKVPLVVDIHDGPEQLSTTCFKHRANTFLELGYAVLMVNYRGSLGNGDAIQQSILGHVGQVWSHYLKYQVDRGPLPTA